MQILAVDSDRPPRSQLGNFTSQDFEILPRSFGSDSSSSQLSTVLFGHGTPENYSLRKSPQFSAKLPQSFVRKSAQILARETPLPPAPLFEQPRDGDPHTSMSWR